MKISEERKRQLARENKLHNEGGDRVFPSDLDKSEQLPQESIPKPKKEIDKQLQILQNTLDGLMTLAKQGEDTRVAIIEAVSNLHIKNNIPAPNVTVKPVIQIDDWSEIESEVTDRDNFGRIKKITHTRIN